MKATLTPLIATIGFLAALHAGPAVAAEPSPAPLAQQRAVVSPGAVHASILGAAWAGSRIVAVGDRGVVLLSDDKGKTFRQSTGVPTRAMLNSVSFAPDGRSGWAAGHLGVVLATHDAGETWQLQRADVGTDQPLFTTRFTSAESGYAAGLWSLFLRTRDAGKSWQPVAVRGQQGGEKGAGGGPNLFSIVSSVKGSLLVASEQGVVFRSVDDGASWSAVQTTNAGTFWVAVSLRSGALLAAGLGGKIYRSADDGQTWQATAPATRSSITGMTQLPSGRVVAVGLDGAMLTSTDDGVTFKASYLAERSDLTSVLATGADTALVFSTTGPLSPSKGFAPSPAADHVAAR